MDLKIDNSNIEKSFDSIALDLLNNKALFVNDKELLITEIEFYYFHEHHHPDNYTHVHERKGGEWRFHNQGLDITLQGDKLQDGGILIRGIKVDDVYVNGPRKIIQQIFKHFTSVTEPNQITLKSSLPRSTKIIKTFRHLPMKIQDPLFHNKYYRYLVNMDDLDIPSSTKEKISKYCVVIK